MLQSNGISETEEDDKQKDFNLNEDFSESCLKAEPETESLVKNGIENVIEMKKKKKTVKAKPIVREVNITRKVLRSCSVARDSGDSEKHQVALEVKRKSARKRDLSTSGNISMICCVDEVKEEAKHEDVESPVPKETHGDDIRSQVQLDCEDDRSGDVTGRFEPHLKVKRKRGRPRKLQINSQCDGNEEKSIGVSCVKEEKAEVKLEYEQSTEDKKVLGADLSSQIDVEIKDENGNVEPHGQEVNVKRKRGRPKKLQISIQSGESGLNANRKLARSQDLSSPSLKPQRGRPTKTKMTPVGLCLKKENVDCGHGSTLITLDKSMSDSINESRRPKRNCGGRAKEPEFDEGNCRGRKMGRKRGRPPTPNKKRKYGETDESDCKAKKRLKLEPRLDNTSNDGERRIGELQSKQIEAGQQSRSKSKKMLSDRILQLLQAAGWTVEYRPRNGREYKDPVYVNPEGKTHWSVTKAYQRYKKHLESSMNDQVNSGFGLLPEDDLHLLGRRTQKKRSDKGKQRQYWKDVDTNESMVSTKGMRKCTLHGKKAQKKRKGSHRSDNLERISVSVRKIKREEKHNRKRGALSARSSLDDADSKENGYVLFEGKRTVLGWMIDSAIVPLNGKVQCMDCKKTQVRLEGIITKDGIRCNCCDEVFSVLDFEVHAGGEQNQPFRSLYLEGGNSLLQCFLESWNKQSETVLKGFHIVDFGVGEQNDDTCAICGDGGDLICCDGCPSTFHQSCLGIKKFPSGAWFCCYCSCKFCEKVEAANHDTTTLSPLLRCRLCEEKYHQTCIKQEGTVLGERSTHSFCGKYCQELFKGLQLLIGVKHPLPEGFSWTFLRRFELPREISDDDISENIAYNAKLAVAFSVMDECFSPLVDHRSGVNLLENIIYNFGSTFHRLNYSNFLTAVLERGDEIIGVASIRIHGNQLAEMPFIGTRYMYRRQGMCRRLMSGIETALGSLNVDKLVIPAVPELMDTWTSGFGFTPVHESAKKTIKNLNLVVFPGVDMLEKPLTKEKISESNVSSSNGDLPLATEMSVPVDVEETKPEESKDSAEELNCATADAESPSYPVDSCLKSMSVEEGDNKDTESNLQLLNGSLEEKEDTDVGSFPNVADNQRDPNSGVADDSHSDQTDTKRQESDSLEDKTPLSNDSRGVRAEVTQESDQQPDCYIIEEKKIDDNTLSVKKEVPSRLRASSRLIQRSWRTSSRVKQKYTNAVLLDSPQRYV
ncbi:uncharacterized protein LOC18012680 isoform X1 [Eutrema salsugineum]|uniref:uncharacterized protein LOC18012680 isoform X1 n=1 Tax=Eutrema salsugineum TaxID=72664 RepID=UPI000CED5605|nr:uncharacterized protein LOC18012680 isoform X1 [Eutrema salsugineum]